MREYKQNIARIGSHPMGFGLYLFDYRPEYQARWGGGRQFGVMIDEVRPICPQAISTDPEGFQVVDYELLGIHRRAPAPHSH